MSQRLHTWVIAPYRRDREHFVDTLTDQHAEESQQRHVYKVDAHKQLRGPYTGTGELLRQLVPALYREHPEIVLAHTVEILSLAPELKTVIPAQVETLTSLAVPDERTRFYSRLRTLRIAHGLVDLFLQSLMLNPEQRSILYFEHVHATDTLDQEFLSVLLRRVKDPAIQIIVGTESELLPDALRQALATYAHQVHVAAPSSHEFSQHLQHSSIPDNWQRWLLQHSAGWYGEWESLNQYAYLQRENAPQGETFEEGIRVLVTQSRCEEIARIFIASDGTSDALIEQCAYYALDPLKQQALHDERAQDLEKLDQWSLHLGAIPYHYEHGRAPSETGAHALQMGLDYCINMGFYEATVDFAYRGRRVIEKEKQLDYYWTFTTKATTSLAALERPEEAEELYNEARALTSNPSIHMQAAYATAMLYTRHHTEKRRNHTLARGWINEAIAIAQLRPDLKERAFHTVFNQNGLALIELHLGRPLEALRLVTEGIARLDETLEPGEHLLHRSVLLYNRAQVYAGLKELEKALDDYTKVIEQDPMYSEYYLDRGNLHRRLGRDQDALQDYERAIKFSPPYPEAYYNRAAVLTLFGNDDAALADYNYILELDPDYLDALINRASILYEKGEYEMARADVEHGLTLDTKNAQLLCTLGLLQMVDENYADAEKTFTTSLELDPTLIPSWSNRAIIAYEQGNLDAAISDLTSALNLSQDASVLYNRGLAYQKKQAWAAAIEDFSQALTLSQDDAQDIFYQRGRCYMQIGDTTRAHQDFERHLQFGNSPHLVEISEIDPALVV